MDRIDCKKRFHIKCVCVCVCLCAERKNHARELVREADLSQWDALVIISGDGLLYEVHRLVYKDADACAHAWGSTYTRTQMHAFGSTYTRMHLGPHTHACGSTHTHPKACMDKQSHTRGVTFYYSFILTKPGKAHFSIKCSISCLFFSCPYMNELPLCHCISSFKK